MKRFMSLSVLLFLIFSFQPSIYAAGSSGEPSVYDSIHKSVKQTVQTKAPVTDQQSSSILPLFFKFIVCFVLVVGLLLLVLRFLSKRNRLLPSSGPILTLGGHSLGNNKSLQIMLIGQTIYIIGVGDSINLIRTVSQGEEYQHLLESFENQGEGVTQKWLPVDTKKVWNSVFRKHMQNMHQENGEE
ncbi:flagellar biosynthetic protein FliO [Bacillus sp. BRMEA1]|uniref:flagellar biosynthetic protein FliO n=1 Tax=Neobacillus endophyticus TaxID=2738405 RepID=UPI001564A9D4|nr:flagellar biosynthetic protein FliO [Neobacillus endophyticus]NRD79412.1 flagellar biosynthetic protein FliO [Neobacillus endophyticus]